MNLKPNKRIKWLLGALLFICIAFVAFKFWLSHLNTVGVIELPPPPPITSTSAKEADLRVLMFGNSHTAMHDLPKLIADMLEEATPGKTYYFDRSPNRDFLAGKWKAKEVQDLFKSQAWDILILQGQKYSTSGRHNYPTDAAENWIQASQKRNIRPILYPEWGQKGDLDEGRRVNTLHHRIAAKTGAEVAPVGMAWEACLNQLPETDLFAFDGNHGSKAGAYLTACVLVATITQRTPEGLMHPEWIDTETATTMQTIAWEACVKHPPKRSTTDQSRRSEE